MIQRWRQQVYQALMQSKRCELIAEEERRAYHLKLEMHHRRAAKLGEDNELLITKLTAKDLELESVKQERDSLLAKLTAAVERQQNLETDCELLKQTLRSSVKATQGMLDKRELSTAGYLAICETKVDGLINKVNLSIGKVYPQVLRDKVESLLHQNLCLTNKL